MRRRIKRKVEEIQEIQEIQEVALQQVRRNEGRLRLPPSATTTVPLVDSGLI